MDASYYKRALDYLADISNPILHIFSDDIEYAKEFFSDFSEYEIKYEDWIPDSDNKDLDEFYLMASCRHQIIANSSFSWWAAYLNNYENKIVIAPASAPNIDYKSIEGVYPKEWIML